MVHSAEALLANAADLNSAIWHQLHQVARRRVIPSNKAQVPLLGTAERLLFFTVNFSNASSVNDETSAGFYDGCDLQV
jgi:hypothetical protein